MTVAEKEHLFPEIIGVIIYMFNNMYPVHSETTTT